MKKSSIDLEGITIPLYSLNTLIVGSGAAALNAAVQLHDRGQEDIAVVTDYWGGGTSNNAGSDKQTYYKQSLSGDKSDSPVQMAEDLFGGGCMHGDIALCEAQNSLQAFFHLVRLGVPFPHDRYGAFPGYKTDHDPLGRGTSAGPLTSHLMFEALASEVNGRGITVFDRHEVIGLLTRVKEGEKHVIGAVALDLDELESPNLGFVVFNAVNAVLGTGGPAGMYRTSVYPESQLGSTGLAFEAGAVGNNLTESQFGIASVKFRWNLSGTYQQVIPRYVSTDARGGEEREFLNDFFPNMGRLASTVFLKGYQWPFDPRKVAGYGSSLIDILVYRETVIKGRRVFLDFMRNPTGEDLLEDFSCDLLEGEAFEYLERSGALGGTPIDRLQRMNPPAIDLYRNQGIALSREFLEIAVCAQHNNGGLKGNIWWESNIRHLFPVGEVAGTHGVYRPGGSALNSGQVGGLRAAAFISKRYDQAPPLKDRFLGLALVQIMDKWATAKELIKKGSGQDSTLQTDRLEIQNRMSTWGAHIRNPAEIQNVVDQAWECYQRMKNSTRIPSARELPAAFKNLDLGLTHVLYLEAITEYLDRGGQSRGSYLVLDPEGERPCEELGEEWGFSLESEDSFVNRKVLELFLDETNGLHKRWIDIRPVPSSEGWFENVWRDYRNDNIIREEKNRG